MGHCSSVMMDMKIGRRIKAWRKRDPVLTLQDIADACHITRQAVQNWEVGRTAPQQDHLAKFCDLRGISLSTFWSRLPKKGRPS